MNIEVVKSVFGAVAPAPVIAEKNSNLIPVLLLIVGVGVCVAIYVESNRKECVKFEKHYEI